jgi:hypothetical protein
MSSAAQPAARGEAMLVPEAATVPSPTASETTPTPGASRSSCGEALEKEAMVSAVVVAPTAMTPPTQAGADSDAASESLPAEAKTTTPRARSALSAAARPGCAALQSPG